MTWTPSSGWRARRTGSEHAVPRVRALLPSLPVDEAPPAEPDEDAELLRRRMRTFATAAGAVATFAFVAHVAMGLTIVGYVPPWGPMTWLLAAAAAVTVPMALVCRRPAHPRLLRAADTFGVLIAATLYSATLRHLDVQHHFDRVAILALALVAVMRAALIPSTTVRTGMVTLGMGVPLVVSVALAYQGYTPYAGDALSHSHTSITMAAWVLVWWIPTTIVCSVISEVTYTLRRAVRVARKLGQYTLVKKIGEGAMGAVYEANHALLRRPTAVKLLPPHRATARETARFEREVQLTSRLTHPNTVTVFDYGRTADGVFFYAMELLEGATLDEIVDAGGPMPPARVAAVMKAVAGALGEAHAVGLIHRDIKPGNIILSRQGGLLDVAKVVDFGLVKDIRAEQSVSRASDVAGTPLYMAPEVLTDPRRVGPRSDLYGLGAVAYFMLTGEPVFSGATMVEVLSHHIHTEPRRPSALVDGVPRDLEQVVMDCLAKDPAQRPASGDELLARLEDCDYVSEWTQADARAWWRGHERAVAQLRERFRHSLAGRAVVARRR